MNRKIIIKSFSQLSLQFQMMGFFTSISLQTEDRNSGAHIMCNGQFICNQLCSF